MECESRLPTRVRILLVSVRICGVPGWSRSRAVDTCEAVQGWRGSCVNQNGCYTWLECGSVLSMLVSMAVLELGKLC